MPFLCGSEEFILSAVGIQVAFILNLNRRIGLYHKAAIDQSYIVLAPDFWLLTPTNERANDGYAMLVGDCLQAADNIAVHGFCQFGMVSAEARGKHFRQYCDIGFVSQCSNTLFCHAEVGFLIRPCYRIL